MIRRPAVAGMFYDGGRDELIKSLEQCFLGKLGPGKLPSVRSDRLGHVIGLVSPHAGFMYSGSAAAHAYAALADDGLPDIAILLGPNHRGAGSSVAVGSDEKWQTPLGDVDVDVEVAEAIVQLSEFAECDDRAHASEHSIEVQLPFLQYLGIGPEHSRTLPAEECCRVRPEGNANGKSAICEGGESIRIVPVSIAHLSLDDALALSTDLGPAIAKAVEGKSTVVIASTDFTHYESKSTAEARDSLAIDSILRLDPAELLNIVYGKSITMCGVVGTAVMLEATKILGAKHAHKLAYYTSGDVTGDTSQVVGYGAVSVVR